MGFQNPLELDSDWTQDYWPNQSLGEPMVYSTSNESNSSNGNSSVFSQTSWQRMPNTPHSYYSESSYSSFGSSLKPTPTTLGWTSNTKLFELYKFIVPKGQDPYFELVPGGQVTLLTPIKVYLDQALSPTKNYYPCMYPPGCEGKKDHRDPFNRQADLERHYRNFHADMDQRDIFHCDHGNVCERREGGKPFTRKDHYRDHLKDFHKEDIGTAKREKRMSSREWEAAQKQWNSERNIDPKRWRCARCLHNNKVMEVAWECFDCKNACELERREIRERMQDKQRREIRERVQDEPRHKQPKYEYIEASESATGCMRCDPTYIGHINDGMGHWVACPDCSVSTSWSHY